eukprot:gnl/MRDRNA2_/MRDRNA2_160808_c0_seq1.p1 gnl/MRDRNA2_/MRDRNA2_160808_c0~~gnl/MRDRNA2_/MRDRNA2_160808_c0_seq1.p1  ORF type:complete len:377 (+),score=53.48 gnl/MRDRNA2_/MRDRNA2_160808_c0_seq1:77-1207(+)
MFGLVVLSILGMLWDASITAGAPTVGRTMTYWADAPYPVIHGKPSCYKPPCTNWSDPAAWEPRFATLTKHRANLTGMIACIHSVGDGGKLTDNGGDGSFENFLPHLPRLKAMGLEITAFLGNSGSNAQAALEAAIKRGPDFVEDAVQMALKNGYDGYAADFELLCYENAECWKKLAPLRKPYVKFLNDLADGLHKHGMILSAFIDGCCGYTDPYLPRGATRGCTGLQATHDYQGAMCLDFRNSSVDRVISAETYGGSWHGDVSPGGKVWHLEQYAKVASSAIGVPKYSVGIKGGFSPPLKPANETVGLNCSTAQRIIPAECHGPFTEAGQKAISALHKLGVSHIAKFMNEPTTQAEWDAWGWHLHGPEQHPEEILV